MNKVLLISAVTVCLSFLSSDCLAQQYGTFGSRIFGQPQAPPQIVLQPVLQYRPLYYQGSQYHERKYPTPLRDLLFGQGHWHHQYSPQATVPYPVVELRVIRPLPQPLSPIVPDYSGRKPRGTNAED